jgi:hypothetical protein
LFNDPVYGISRLARTDGQYKQIALQYGLRKKFGDDGYHVSFIVNPPDVDIPVGQLTGAKATNYNLLKTRLGENSSMASIHSTDYTVALNNVVTFVENRIINSMTLPALNSGESIAVIARVRSGIPTTLNTTQYSISGSSLSVSPGVLQAGDQIRLTIKRP